VTKTWAHLHLPRFAKGEQACISVKHGRAKIAYTGRITLRDVIFKVHEGGRIRTITTGIRNVHAWCVGTPTQLPRVDFHSWKRAIYDPRKSAYFCDADTLRPLLGAAIIVMEGKNVYYKVGTYA
jgi:hypothetical protein